MHILSGSQGKIKMIKFPQVLRLSRDNTQSAYGGCMIAAGADCLRILLFCCLPPLLDPQISSWSLPHWWIPGFLPVEGKTLGVKPCWGQLMFCISKLFKGICISRWGGKNELCSCPIWSGTLELHGMYCTDKSMLIVTEPLGQHHWWIGPVDFIHHLWHKAEDDPENAIGPCTRAEDTRDTVSVCPMLTIQNRK